MPIYVMTPNHLSYATGNTRDGLEPAMVQILFGRSRE